MLQTNAAFKLLIKCFLDVCVEFNQTIQFLGFMKNFLL